MKAPRLLILLLPWVICSQAVRSATTPPLTAVPFDAPKAIVLREEWSQALGLPAQFTNHAGMKLLLIPGGRFRMGPNGSGYQVTLSRAFYLGEAEVTLGQYRRWKPEHRLPGAAAEFNEDNRPVAGVSWNEAREYCRWLSAQPEERAAGRSYSLPTEAQWEWAARAGTETSRYFGESDKGQEAYSWFNSTYTPNPEKESGGRGRQPVMQLKPNAWGLYDLLGNVWEWCDDRRVDEATGEERQPVMRGGSWRSGAFHCTATAHDPGDPNSRGDNIGFRLACRSVGAPLDSKSN